LSEAWVGRKHTPGTTFDESSADWISIRKPLQIAGVNFSYNLNVFSRISRQTTRL